ncbi:MAG TPA: isoprenylcysteine carboxylmethyltransferase family protein [Planctomycetota bacterium]
MSQQGEAVGGSLPGGGAEPARTRGGLAKLLHDLRHRRRRFRQLVGVAFVAWMTLVGRPIEPLWWLGAGLAVLGMLVRLWASGFVMKNEVLATVGPYARVRHPLYVGNALICAGFCAASGLWWSVPVAVAMWLAFYPQTIRYEDQKLRRLFPDQWDRWASETRALLPRLTPYPGSGERVPWSLMRSLLRNGEPLHILLLGGGLWYLHAQL